VINLLEYNVWSLFHKHGFNKKYIHIADEITGLKKNFFYGSKEKNIFQPDIDIISNLRVTDNYLQADFVLIPHPWVSIQKRKSYLDYLVRLSRDVPLLVANSDDVSPRCDLPNTLQFRSFLHPKESSFRKIVFPYPAHKFVSNIRNWRPVPRVSFIGFVPKFGLGSLTSKSSSFIKSPLKTSVYINRRITVIKLKNLDWQFDITCIPRKQFTLLSDNNNLKSHMIEYKENLAKTDYVICPRGFANTSIRFYEALSAGATPILIDSGSPLPQIETKNFWDNNILKLSLFSDWSQNIWNDWQNLGTNANYLKRQLLNAEVFEQELYFENFVRKIFRNYLKISNV